VEKSRRNENNKREEVETTRGMEKKKKGE